MDINLTKIEFWRYIVISPERVIGKKILYQGNQAVILDVSFGGDFILLEAPNKSKVEWVLISNIGNSITLDIDTTTDPDSFTVQTYLKRIGPPSSEQTKPLFEIVENLNKQILELRMEISNLKTKEGIKAEQGITSTTSVYSEGVE